MKLNRVLIVDDEPLIVQNLKQAVPWQEIGCEIVGEAGNGIKALELCRDVRPHIVITDIRMPKMDGIRFMEQLRAETPEMPAVILLSGYDEFEYARQAMRLGAYDYLLKPIDYKELKNTVQRAIRQNRHARKLRMAQLKNELYELLLNEEIEPSSTLDDKRAWLCLVAGRDAKHGDLSASREFVRRFAPRGADLAELKLNKNRTVLVLACDDREALGKTRSQLLAHPKEMFGYALGVGTVAGQIRELPDSFRQAEISASVKQEDHHYRDYDRTDRSEEAVEKARKYIEAHYGDDLCLDDVADAAEVSVSYLSPHFKKQMGMTFLKYLTRLRVEKAKVLLEETEMQTSRIASEVGYQDSRYFGQVFKQWTGLTPSEYRKKAARASE